MSDVIELAKFTVEPDDEERFLAARPGMVEAVKTRFPGLKELHLARLDDGAWIDVIFWESREDAQAAAAEAESLADVRNWLQHVAEDVSMEHGVLVD